MAVIDVYVASIADDGYDNEGVNWVNSAPMTGNSGSALLQMGLRFPAVAVPAGATINSATLRLRAERDQAAATGVHGIIRGDDVDDAPAWSNSSRPASGFTATTASTSFDPSAWATGAYYTYDVATIVAEIVARAGWGTGQAIRFAILDNASSSGIYVRAYDYADGGGDPYNAKLTIDYTEGASADPPTVTILRNAYRQHWTA